MNSYQKAIKALEECVKDAMENDVNSGTQSEIWRHYQGMKAIAKQIGRATSIEPNIRIGDGDAISFDYDRIVAGQPVNFSTLETNDVITFS
jgi:hypothetical protein